MKLSGRYRNLTFKNLDKVSTTCSNLFSKLMIAFNLIHDWLIMIYLELYLAKYFAHSLFCLMYKKPILQFPNYYIINVEGTLN